MKNQVKKNAIPITASFLNSQPRNIFLVRTVLSVTQRSTCILHRSKKTTTPKISNDLTQLRFDETWYKLYCYTGYAQVVLIIGITERISHSFCYLTIFGTRSWLVVLASGTFSSTDDNSQKARTNSSENYGGTNNKKSKCCISVVQRMAFKRKNLVFFCCPCRNAFVVFSHIS